MTLREWCHDLEKVHLDVNIRQPINLAIALAFLIQSGRENISVTPIDLDFVWTLIYGALISDSIQFKANRSALGYHSVPLWSHGKDGNIDELFRLHVWIPDDHEKRTPISNIHTHQAFGQGWILTGLGTDYVHEIESADMSTATHTEFNIAWNKDKSEANDKITQQSAPSTMTNTGSLVRAVAGSRRPHSRGMSYTVPAGKYHSLDVGPDELHATLFFFDSRRGFQVDAPALGPIHGSSLILPRTAPGVMAAQLAKTVDCLRQWEVLSALGKLHVRNAEWEEGLRALRKAERLCIILDGESHSPLKHAPRYKWAVQGEIGHAYRMLGRNSDAIELLDTAIKQMPPNLQRIELMGELSVVYRHLNRLEASKHCSADAYKTAKQLLSAEATQDPGAKLKLEKEMCRAIGDWGMVNYQLYLDTRDSDLLDLAMNQMTERIDIARRVKAAPELESLNGEEQEELREYCSQREAIALARLSLCFAEKGELDKAVTAARQALDIQRNTQSDPTKIAFSRYFYGRALLRSGRKEEAKIEFNPPNTCTPTIALCKESSDEHRSYIREMIAAGADMELRDEQGYSALECAVYCGDIATQLVIEEGLRKKFLEETDHAQSDATSNKSTSLLLTPEERLDRLRYEAHVRKGYRQLVQDTLRPVLLQAQGSSGLDQLRTEYANALKDVNKEKLLFDSFKVVYYSDFIRARRIPKYGDGFTKEIISNAGGVSVGEFIIFFSYRWIGSLLGQPGASPDDDNNTQYQRMVRALNEFLQARPHIDQKKLCVWIDYACVDQSIGDLQAAGIVSLPLKLAQCSAMISLTDDHYYERSWCCIEVMMMQTLRRSYKFHMWFEDAHDEVSGTRVFREAPVDLEINMAEKKVTFEHDRPTLLFLERQTKLLE
ncbi:uncharacterized protein BDZ99DRAFT_487582 [Mytilinidion resinicola]|uniref:Heterokaryon incompatibility domain-containing protein n=1 Tax=Mytilinidion resinicola TaxID=574789 RepID=A0A6A6YPB4_9PEZI|nr:uncharacterized protein BDZ99DRAFT_487582 [Mytilinidion resinicola]KAF2810736.1 hypothetical protein BDZ99DRAFT_487582 [Mytilinidion resinicola]